MSQKLFSIGLVSYNNSEFIYEALDAIFMQDYDNIELIISDDGSKFFDKDKVIKYIEKNKSNNISNYVININNTNLGTVKNLNKVLDYITGEFVLFHACDDKLYDRYVLKNIANFFDKLGEKAYAISTQVGMYNYDLTTLKEYAVDKESINYIKTLTANEMYMALSYKYIIPAAGTFYRKKIFNICGKFDERFFITEDIEFFSRMSKKGITTHFLDIISVKHRDGGISHGNTSGTEEVYEKYIKDSLLWFEIYSLPNKSLLTKEQCKIINEKYYGAKVRYMIKAEWKYSSIFQKIKIIASKPFVVFGIIRVRKLLGF